jgi:hypothetical protein
MRVEYLFKSVPADAVTSLRGETLLRELDLVAELPSVSLTISRLRTARYAALNSSINAAGVISASSRLSLIAVSRAGFPIPGLSNAGLLRSVRSPGNGDKVRTPTPQRCC